MGIINLKTNLKSLRFGNDIQGGGSSGLPYIKPGLPENSPAGEYLAGIARASADWPLRGGTYSTIASTEDSVRISRFLTDFPKGSIFTAKQVGLQKSNPRIETGGRTSRLNTQTYNLNANLLAQVFEQGTGIHIPRAGANANELGPDGLQNKYEYIVSHKESNNNRLVTLFNLKLNSNTTGLSLDSTITKLGISTDKNLLFNYVGGPNSLYGDGNTTIFKATDFQGVPINTSASFNNFKEGPFYNKTYTPGFNFFSKIDFEGVNSRYSSLTKYILDSKISGIKNEFGLISSDSSRNTLAQQGNNKLTSGDYIRPEKNPSDFDKYTYGQPNYFGNTMAYSKLLSSKTISGPAKSYDLQDFRSKTIDENYQALDYTNPSINIATRVGIGSPGSRTRDQRKAINQVNYDGQDQVNMIPLYADTTDPFNGKPEARDLIKFAFETIDNDDITNSTKIHFRAFLTNFSDNHGAVWNGQRYMGRGEEFFTYQGFTRDISFQFKVAAQSKQEMLPLWQKLNYLASSLYPDYNGQGFMRGNIHKLTIGEYFYRTPGILKSMNITVDDNYPWEIKYVEPETARSFSTEDFIGTTTPGSKEFAESNSDADMMELPQVINVSCTFTPILNELPSLSKVTSTTIDKKHMLISDHGIQENFINRLELPNKRYLKSNNITYTTFNINTPTGDINP